MNLTRLDEEMIESLFGYNLQNSTKNNETISKTLSPKEHVLEPKRLQNIAILSKALNITAEEVCEALILGKGSYFINMYNNLGFDPQSFNKQHACTFTSTPICHG